MYGEIGTDNLPHIIGSAYMTTGEKIISSWSGFKHGQNLRFNLNAHGNDPKFLKALQKFAHDGLIKVNFGAGYYYVTPKGARAAKNFRRRF